VVVIGGEHSARLRRVRALLARLGTETNSGVMAAEAKEIGD
jgi:hypothetical protein